MDLHSKMTMYITSTMTSPVTKTAKTSKWLRLKESNLSQVNYLVNFIEKSDLSHNSCLASERSLDSLFQDTGLKPVCKVI